MCRTTIWHFDTVGRFWFTRWATEPRPLLRLWDLALADVAFEKFVRVTDVSRFPLVELRYEGGEVVTWDLRNARCNLAHASDPEAPKEILDLGFRVFLKVRFRGGRLVLLGEVAE